MADDALMADQEYSFFLHESNACDKKSAPRE
jgi:hypothetical protein